MIAKYLVAVATLLGTVAQGANSAQGGGGSECAFVSDQSNAVHIINVEENAVSDRISVGGSSFSLLPSGIALTGDGRTVVIADFISPGYISYIDTADHSVVNLPIGFPYETPIDIALNPSTGLAYLTANHGGPSRILVVDPATRSVVGRILTTAVAQGVAVAPDGGRAFVGYITPGQVLDELIGVIDIATSAEVARIRLPLGARARGLAVSPDGQTLYANDPLLGNVHVVDVEARTLLKTVTGGVGRGDCDNRVPSSLAPAAIVVSPNGERVYATDPGSGTVRVIDTGSMSVVASPGVGRCPTGIATTLSGEKVFVANAGGSVSVIDSSTDSVVATLPIGGNPTSIVIGVVAGGCPPATPTVTPSPTATAPPTFTPTDTSRPTPSVTPTDTRTATTTATPTVTPTANPTYVACEGNCNLDLHVSTSELRDGVEIALGTLSVGGCLSLDSDNSGTITVDEVVRASVNAIFGCGVVPPTWTAVPTSTRTGTVTPTWTRSSTRTASPTITQTLTPSSLPTPSRTAVPCPFLPTADVSSEEPLCTYKGSWGTRPFCGDSQTLSAAWISDGHRLVLRIDQERPPFQALFFEAIVEEYRPDVTRAVIVSVFATDGLAQRQNASGLITVGSNISGAVDLSLQLFRALTVPECDPSCTYSECVFGLCPLVLECDRSSFTAHGDGLADSHLAALRRALSLLRTGASSGAS